MDHTLRRIQRVAGTSLPGAAAALILSFPLVKGPQWWPFSIVMAIVFVAISALMWRGTRPDT